MIRLQTQHMPRARQETFFQLERIAVHTRGWCGCGDGGGAAHDEVDMDLGE